MQRGATRFVVTTCILLMWLVAPPAPGDADVRPARASAPLAWLGERDLAQLAAAVALMWGLGDG
jgi:hypothetical protein